MARRLQVEKEPPPLKFTATLHSGCRLQSFAQSSPEMPLPSKRTGYAAPLGELVSYATPFFSL